MSDRPPFPEIVDSTIIGSFRSCRRKFELEYLNHWKPKVPSVHLHAGGAQSWDAVKEEHADRALDQYRKFYANLDDDNILGPADWQEQYRDRAKRSKGPQRAHRGRHRRNGAQQRSRPRGRHCSGAVNALLASTANSFDLRSYGLPATSERSPPTEKPASMNSFSNSSGAKY